MELIELSAVAKQFGPLAAAIIFFLWRDWRREDRLATRIETLESEQRKVILPLVKETSEIIARNTTVMERLEKLLELQPRHYPKP